MKGFEELKFSCFKLHNFFIFRVLFSFSFRNRESINEVSLPGNSKNLKEECYDCRNRVKGL